MTDLTKKPKIVILGAGFGGIYTFIHLRDLLESDEADITIINKTNYFLFTPLLHEVATGGLAHHQVVEPIRAFTYDQSVTLHVAEVSKINTISKVVETSVGPVSYDYLVIATGASPEFYGIPGADKTMVLKTLRDAIKVRNSLIDAFEKAAEIKDPVERKRLLTFVLVGGGATGVEMAAEMAQMFYDTFSRFFCGRIPHDDISINLIAGEPELIPHFHKKIRDRAQKILTQKEVKVRTNIRVTGVDDKGVTLSDGSRIETVHVVWTAGLKPNIPESDVEFDVVKMSGRPTRIAINNFLEVKNQKSIYALGDVATFEDEYLPTHAQTAVQQAATVANNIYVDITGWETGDPKKVFKYKPIGDLVSLGQWQAVGHFFKTLWTGPLAWFIWRTVYLFKYPSWPKRIKIAVDWTIDIFYPRDITRA